MSRELLIIGGGPGGAVAALRAAKKELDVTLVEKDKIGGVCLNVGCIPSKILVNSSDIVYSAQNNEEMGINVENLTVDFKKMSEYVHENVQKNVSGLKWRLKRAGVDIRKAKASFISSQKARVGDETIEFENAIIASGSTPRSLPNVQVDHEDIMNSADVFGLERLPSDMLIIGAGYIGMELGMVCRKLGVDITIMEIMDQILPPFDEEVVKPIQANAEKLGIQIYLNQKVSAINNEGDQIIIKTEQGKRFSAEECLISIGRKPFTNSLHLDNTKVELDSNGYIKTNKNQKTQDSNIYAVGDVTQGKMLAHKAYQDAVIAVDSILGEDTKKSPIPEVVFTDPPLARVGEIEGYKTGTVSFKKIGAAYTKGKTDGMIQIAVNDDGIIKGGQIVGVGASEIIHEVGIAVNNQLSIKEVGKSVHIHPTISEGIVLAAEDAGGLDPSIL